jgi:dipeptidyl aminopeptidase/acylaminoacyl peptidase
MRRIRWISLLALVFMLLNLTVANASVIFISPTQPAGILEDKGTVNKIAALQNLVKPSIRSYLSPDGKTLLASFLGTSSFQLVFLNTQDGSTVPAQVDGSIPPAPITSPVWFNTTTLGWIAEVRGAPVLVTLNRDTGKGSFQNIGLPGYPLSIAPNGSRVLMVAQTRMGAGSSESGEASLDYVPMADPLVSPFDMPVRKSFQQEQSQWGDKDLTTLRFAAPSLILLSLDLRNGRVTPLYELSEGTALTGISWSATGDRLAVSRKSVPNIGRTGNLLSDIATQDGLGQLPPEKNPFFQNDLIDLVDFNSFSVKPAALKAAGGNGDGFAGGLSWSPDGKTLAVKMAVPSRIAGRPYPTYFINQSSYHRYYTADGQLLYSFESEETNAASTSFPVFVSPDEVITRASRGTNISLFYHNKATGEFRKLPLPDGSVFNFVANERTRQIVFTFTSFLQVPEFFRINFDGTGLTQLTSYNKNLAEISKVRVDPVDFTLANGQKRSGYLIQPAGAQFPPVNVPLVMWQEGGPSGPYNNYFGTNVEAPFNLLPQFGISILFVPFPGREGFGPAFFNALADNRNFGQIDIDEGAEVMRQAIARGYTSPVKTGITGCSYGGYFTSQSISRHPDLYAAANTQCTLLEFFNEWQFGGTPFVSYLMGSAPTRDGEEYYHDSPLYNAGRIKTPTLIFSATQDFLPYRFSINLHDQLTSNGVATNLLIFEKEGHGLTNPHSELIAGQAQVSWFRQFLGVS